MSLNLSAPDTSRLPRAPLQLAVCQLRYEPVLGVSEFRLAEKVHRELGGDLGPYPRVDRNVTQAVNIQLTEAGVQSGVPQQQQGWRFVAQDESWVVALMPDQVILQTTAYTTWHGDFSERLAVLFHAVAQHVAPEAERRLGLRYVNRISVRDLKTPMAWRKYIVSEFLGPLLHETLGPAVQSAQQQLDITVDETSRCTIRHGFLSDSSGAELAYLIDSDVYREGYRGFDEAGILDCATAYNYVALQLFQQMITPKALQRLGENDD